MRMRLLVPLLLSSVACRPPSGSAPAELAAEPEAGGRGDLDPRRPEARAEAGEALDPALRDRLFAEVDDYLRAEDPGVSPPLLARLEGEYRSVSASLLAAAVRWRRQPPLLPSIGLHQATWSALNPPRTGRYDAFVPATLGAVRADRFPLIIFLHGAGGDGAGVAGGAGLQQAAARLGAILVAPTSEPGCDWSADEDCMAQVVHLVRILKRRYPVDDARVVLTGASMGGRGAFSVGVAYPDPYCGVVPVAGSIGAVHNTSDLAVHKAYCCPHVENLKNLRLHYISGELDMALMIYQNRGCELCLKELGNEYVYTELKGQGHVFPPDLWEKAVAWTLARPRPRYPSSLVYNLATQASGEPPGYIWTQQTLRSPPYWLALDERQDSTKPARVEVRVDGNDLRLKSTNVLRLTLRLAPEMLKDPTRPLRVLRDGDGTVLWQGALTPDRRWLLEEARRWSERDAVYSFKLSLELTP